MNLIGEQLLLRAYLQNADRSPYTPTHELIVKLARRQRLAGATVLRGIMGFGSRGEIRPSRWSLAMQVPVIVELVDRPERIIAFVEGPLSQIMRHGMLTLERARVMTYRARQETAPHQLEPGAFLVPLSTVPSVQPSPNMKTNQPGVLLRIFAGESDQAEGKPLYEAIVQRARKLGLAGATVLRGVEGFGANSVVHKAKLLDLSADLPIVIEIVDTEEKIRPLLPYLQDTVRDGMITMEHVQILVYRHNPNGATQGA